MVLTRKQKEIFRRVKEIEEENKYRERCFKVDVCYKCGEEELEWQYHKGMYCNKCKKFI